MEQGEEEEHDRRGAQGHGRSARPPLVGVTGRRWPARLLAGHLAKAVHDAEIDLHFTDYSQAIASAGGLPVGLSRDAPTGALLDRLDALVVSGGADVDPRCYGVEPGQGCGPIEPERDAWELELLAGALDRKLPVLAICRGLQVLNVLEGGTLVQDVQVDEGDGHPRFDEERHTLAHSVRFAPGSVAAEIYGSELIVNSLHHQVVERVGTGLTVTGRSPDGTVEALELTGLPLLAVQWHPEMLRHQPDPAMRWLVDEAARCGASRLVPN